MLRFLTQKFRAQSLNEVRPAEPQGPLSCFVDECEDEVQDEKDENDNEQAVYRKELNKDHTEENDNFGSATCTSQNTTTKSHPRSRKDGKLNTERIIEIHKSTGFSDLGDHSTFTPREPAEKRKWSQMNIVTRQILSQINSGGTDSSSSDDEIKELCARRPKAILLSSSPPEKITLHSAPHGCSYITRCSSRLGTGHHGHIRKRHRLQPFSEDMCRPSLDFEKMQQKTLFRKQQHNGVRPRVVKIRSISTSGFTPNLVCDPEVLSFKPIALKPFNLAPVEEPNLAF